MKKTIKATPSATSQPETMEIPIKFIGTASTDAAREILHNVFIDEDKRAVVATNGRILARLDLPGTAPVKGGMISPQLWKSARAMTKKGPLVLDFVNGTIATLPYPQDQARGSYPNWPAVVPTIENPAYRLCIDPALLLDLAESLGRHDQAKGVTIDLDASCETPIVVSVAGNSGVIMPMNATGNTNGHGLRTSNIERPTSNVEGTKKAERSASPAAPARLSQPAIINHLSVSAIDRADMMREPISWLERISAEIRHLRNNHPSGGQWIADYLELVDAGDYERFETAETARDEATNDLETANDDLKAFRELLKQITEDIKSSAKDGFSLADPARALVNDSTLGSLIIRIANDIQESDTEFSLDSDEIACAVETAEAKFKLLQRDPESEEEPETVTAEAEHSAPSSESSDQKSTILTPQSSISSSSTAPTLSRNGEKNGIELRFAEKPTDEVRAEMKSHGFKWSSKQPGQPWYARYTEERWIFATGLAESTAPLDATGPDFAPEAMAPAPTEMKTETSPATADAFADF